MSHSYRSEDIASLPVACMCVKSLQFVSDSLQPYGLQPTRLLCPWDSPGKNIGLPFPSPGDLPDPEIEPVSCIVRQIVYH